MICPRRSDAYFFLASKTVTREQAEAKRQKAVDFLNRMGDSDAADDFDAMSTDEYAEHKG